MPPIPTGVQFHWMFGVESTLAHITLTWKLYNQYWPGKATCCWNHHKACVSGGPRYFEVKTPTMVIYFRCGASGCILRAPLELTFTCATPLRCSWWLLGPPKADHANSSQVLVRKLSHRCGWFSCGCYHADSPLHSVTATTLQSIFLQQRYKWPPCYRVMTRKGWFVRINHPRNSGDLWRAVPHCVRTCFICISEFHFTSPTLKGSQRLLASAAVELSLVS